MARVEFDSTKKPLDDLLKKARDGLLQLPDFQRGWVWEDEGLRSLLASISRSFPVGAVMTLQSGGEVRFKPRTIEGAPALSSSVSPESLLLDGQQRITSLYQTTMRQEVVDTINSQKRKIKRYYFIDMAKALDETVDRFDAIVGLPESKIETRNFGRETVRDLSSREAEFELCMFPTNQIFDWNSWQTGFVAHWKYSPEKTEFWFRFLNQILAAFHQYQMPVIELGRKTSREAVCLVFEKVNTGGKKLDAFELLTAIYAGEKEGFELRKEWFRCSRVLADSLQTKENPLARVQPTEFFQALALLHTRERRIAYLKLGQGGDAPAISCTRDTILGIPLVAYEAFAKELEEGFKKAGQFLFRQKIYWFKDVPYQSQIVPLAAILAVLGDRWEHESVRKKLSQWYWCGVFGELYGSAIETRFAKDLMEVLAWVDGGQEPTTVWDAAFRAERLETMTSRLSAAYKGVHARLMQEGSRDFRTGECFDHTTYFAEAVDIHHIFPRKWCDDRQIPRSRYDNVINKTPLTLKTNRVIGGDAPSHYLDSLLHQGGGSAEEIDDKVRSHLIKPEMLRSDDFDAFIADRKAALLKLISNAMGKALDGPEMHQDELMGELWLDEDENEVV